MAQASAGAAAAAAGATTTTSVEELRKLKALYDAGHMTKDEFEKRKATIIDKMTGTSSDKSAVTSPQIASENKRKNDLYAGKHFDHTNTDALKHGAYLVITPPVASNRHLHTGDLPDNPYSFITAPVPIDPKRAQRPADNTKKKNEEVLVFASQQPGSADRVEQVRKMEEDKRKLSWELFLAASLNDIPRVKELLDRGADINQRDTDTEGTPIIIAAAKGQKHAVYFLIERGALIDAQNHRGETALHEAVKNRFNEMALMLVKNGADIHLENYRSISPYDLALPWLQKEMKDAREHFLKDQKERLKQKKLELMTAGSPTIAPDGTMRPSPDATVRSPPPITIKDLEAMKPARPKGQTPEFDERYGAPQHKKIIRGENGAPIEEVLSQYVVPEDEKAKDAAAVPVQQETVKLYLLNNSYRPLLVTSVQTSRDVVEALADKLGLVKYSTYLEIVENLRGEQRRLDANEFVLATKKKWPLLLGPSGNETEVHCRFFVVPKKGTPETIIGMYREAIGTR